MNSDSAQSSQVDSDRQRDAGNTSKPVRPSGCALLMVFGLLGTLMGAGIGWGMGFMLGAESLYESRCVIMIEANSGSTSGIPSSVQNMTPNDHLSVISSPQMLENALSRDDLFQLKTFEGLNPSESTSWIKNHFQVSSDPEQPNVFELVVQARHPKESAILTNSIVESYKRHLRNTSSNQKNQVIAEMRQAFEKFADKSERLRLEILKMTESFPAGFSIENETKSDARMVQLDLRLTQLKKEIEEVEREKNWIRKSIEEGQGFRELVWMLVNEKKILPESSKENQVGNKKEENSRQQKDGGDDKKQNQDASNRAQMIPALTDEAKVNLYLLSLDKRLGELNQDQESSLKSRERFRKDQKVAREQRMLLQEKKMELDLVSEWMETARTKLVEINPDLLDHLLPSDERDVEIMILERPALGKVKNNQLWWLGFGALGGLLMGGFLTGFIVLVRMISS